MDSRAPFFFLVVLLILSGIGAATYRQQTYDIPWLPAAEAQIWQVEARIELETSGAPTQVYLTLPPAQQGFDLINEAAASSGWDFTINKNIKQRHTH